MSTKLYVGNLSFETTTQDLEKMFGEIGTVESVNIIEDRDTGRSRGFGFIEMSSSEEAQTAIASFNGKEIDGRSLTVNEAKPRETGPVPAAATTAEAAAATAAEIAAVATKNVK